MNFNELGKKIRESFLSDLKEIELDKIFKISSEYLIGKERFFGDFYVIYLSEIFNIKDEEIIIKLGTAFLFGRAFVIAQDQILDNPDNLNLDYILSSPVLYEEFVKRMTTLVDEPSFKKDMYQILKELREANIKEQQEHRKKISNYTQNDLNNIGRKTGIVKIPAKAVCYLAGDKKNTEKMASIIDKILVVIQICDDLSDVAEDFKTGNYTIPVTHGILLSPNQIETEKSVYQGLFFSGLFECLLSHNLKLLRQINKDIKIITQKETQTEKYLFLLEKYLSNTLKEFRKTKRFFNIGKIEEEDFTKLKPIQCNEEVDKFMSYLEKIEPANLAPRRLM